MKTILPLLALFLLAGCASSVAPAGPDTYFVSYGPLPIWMSAAKAKAECYQKAGAWCAKRGLVMVPLSDNEQQTVVGRAGSAELTFRALKPNDPEIQRPHMDVVAPIERKEIIHPNAP